MPGICTRNVVYTPHNSLLRKIFLGEDEEDEESEPSSFDYVMHYLTVLWKVKNDETVVIFFIF